MTEGLFLLPRLDPAPDCRSLGRDASAPFFDHPLQARTPDAVGVERQVPEREPV